MLLGSGETLFSMASPDQSANAADWIRKMYSRESCEKTCECYIVGARNYLRRDDLLPAGKAAAKSRESHRRAVIGFVRPEADSITFISTNDRIISGASPT